MYVYCDLSRYLVTLSKGVDIQFLVKYFPDGEGIGDVKGVDGESESSCGGVCCRTWTHEPTKSEGDGLLLNDTVVSALNSSSNSGSLNMASAMQID